MTTPTVPLRQQIPIAAAQVGVDALEDALAHGLRWLRFGAPLEHAYERDTGVARTVRHVFCNALGAASFWMLSGVDVATDDGSGAPLALIRAVVGTISLFIIACLWFGRRSVGAWQRETLTAVGTLLIAGYAAVAAHQVGGGKALMQGSGLLLVFLHAGIAARLQFRYALAVNVVASLAHAIWARSSSPETALVLHGHLLLFSVVVVFATVGNYLLEFRERRSYVLECLKAKHHEALLADAEALRELSVRDGLTGLFNRRRFDTELARAWAAGHRGAGPVALLQVDVDHFKRYNDHYGHPAGDRCLFEVADALRTVAERHGGLAARVGGEEFALLLPGRDSDRAVKVAAEACEAVRALALPHAGSSCAQHVTVSIGAAALQPGPGAWASALIGAADGALYAAKAAGRDRALRFEEQLAPATSPRVRKTHDSVPPALDAPADDLVRIDRLSGVLGRGLRWLRFPADLETEFQERGAAERRRQLAFFSVGGMAMMLVYIALSRPVFPDIADAILTNLLGLSIGGLAVAAVNLKFAFGWRLREGLFALMIAGFALAIVAFESESRSSTVYSATLGLCLLPMFGALIAAQPLRISFVPSLVVCVAVAVLLVPDEPERRAAWAYTLALIVCATVYSLVGAYLLELSNRRAYLLDRLRIAQLAVLRHNTEHLQRLATLDPLTRLPNRRHFEAELERLAAACAAERQPLALLILDVDHFKHYNDGYGHPAGDACLQRVGTALLQWARSSAPQPLAGRAAVPARIGGEEFGVLLPGSSASAALAAAQCLRELMRDLRIEHAHSPLGRFVTVSVGAASLALDSAADARLLLKAADAALYRAKGLGRDQAAA